MSLPNTVKYLLAMFVAFWFAVFIVWIFSPLTIGVNRTLLSYVLTTVLQSSLPFVGAIILAFLRRYVEFTIFLATTGFLITFYNLIALWLPILTTAYL